MQEHPTSRRIERVRFELKIREVEVLRRELISPGFVAVTFAGEALAHFDSLSFDDHIKFILPDKLDVDGGLVRRDYTPRNYDKARRELTLEFALHSGGAASDWAAQASPGQRAAIGGPKGSMIIPTDYDWHLLVGDITALPAIHRRLEELPNNTRATVIALVTEHEDRRPMATAAKLDLQWSDSAEDLLQRVVALDLDDQGFVWCAGESSLMARVSDAVLRSKGMPRESTRISAYWKQGSGS